MLEKIAPDALALEIARLKAENERLAREQVVQAFVQRRRVEDVMSGEVRPDGDERTPSLPRSQASAEAWARFRPAPRGELSPIEKMILDAQVERQVLLTTKKKVVKRKRK